jgi:hypothetical protein
LNQKLRIQSYSRLLEPCAEKLACTVLRGERVSDVPDLPDQLMMEESRMKVAPLKLPYGNSDFHDIRTGNFFYVDKTSYIEKLEQLNAKYLFFIRPRRFGKSLFLSMLEHYYDRNKQDDFERLFGDLYIGKYSTERRNQYFILYLDFSGLDTSDSALLKGSFQKRFKGTVIRFLDKYSNHFKNVSKLKSNLEQSDDIVSVWEILFEAVAQSATKIYLIIDEYDHFANSIIATGDGLFYKDIIRASGFVRNFYEVVKIGTKSVIDRIFVTGVSPIMLDDLTSGFNISKNLTMHPTFGEMLGFTEEEVRGLVDQFESNIAPEVLMDDLRSNYNGYLFHEDGKSRMYNPDMILYFFDEWSTSGHFPKQLIDDNVKTDYTRLRRLISNEDNRSMLTEIIANEQVTTQIISRFSFDNMYSQENFTSLLFYMGFLTIEKAEYNRRVKLVIPNYVIKTVLWEYFGRMLQDTTGLKYRLVNDLHEAILEMALKGNIEPFVDFIGEKIRGISFRDTLDELFIKGILLCYLGLTDTYRVISEREVQNGYPDLLLKKGSVYGVDGPEVKFEWMLELKYIKKKNQKQLERVREEAQDQLKEYMTSRYMAGRPNLKAVALIFIGKGEIVVDHFTR